MAYTVAIADFYAVVIYGLADCSFSRQARQGNSGGNTEVEFENQEEVHLFGDEHHSRTVYAFDRA